MLGPAHPFPKMRPDPGLFDIEPINAAMDFGRTSRGSIAGDMSWAYHNLEKSKPIDPVGSTAPWNANITVAEQGRLSSYIPIASERPEPIANDNQLSEMQNPENRQAVRAKEMKLQPRASGEHKCLSSSFICALDPIVKDIWCPVFGKDDHQSLCGLDSPGSSRTRSQPHIQIPMLPSPQKQRRRRWSIGACRSGIQGPSLSTNRSRSQSVSSTTSTDPSEAPPAAKLRQWCEKFCRTWTQGFERAYWDLGQVWKGVCFAHLRGGYGIVRNWDKALQADVRHIWQPLSDFHYVVEIYPHLSDARNYRLHPELTARYLSWMTTEQMEIHTQLCSNPGGENWASVDEARDDNCVRGDLDSAGSVYPLTTRQLFKVARVCNDAEWAVKSLLDWLDEFRRCRAAFVWVDEQRRYDLRTDCAQRGYQAIENCLEQSKRLVATLDGSLVLLCEAMGLDPVKVPSCCCRVRDGQESRMSGAAVTQVNHVPRQQDGPKLERSFEFQRASIQIGHIALKMNIHAPFLSHGAAKAISRRMLARSEKLANQAMKAGERRTEAKVRRLSEKIRDISQRTDQEALPETISLLDSVTRPAVLEPRSGGGVRTYDELAKLPLETLLDKLSFMLAPAKKS